jgi:hypothetical protein
MDTIKLNRNEITEKIEAGATYSGCYVLAVDPDTGYCRVHWMETNRQWDPWPAGARTILIPSLWPDGSGREHEQAVERLRDLHDTAYQVARDAEEDFDAIAYMASEYADDWAACKSEQIHYLVDEFMAACNGDQQDDPSNPSGWNWTFDEDGEPLDTTAPAHFVWV